MKASFSLVLMLGVLFVSCKDSSVSSIEEKGVTKDELLVVQSSANQTNTQSASSGSIIIDDFNGPTGSWSGDFPGLYTYLEDETVLGGGRELRSYRSGVTRINGSEGTLEWGGTNTSTEYALYYGNFIGSHGSPTKGSSPHADKKVFLNLDIGLEGAVVLEVLNISEVNNQITMYLSSTDGGWFYYTNVTLTEGEVQVPLSSFKAFEYNTPMPAEAAADIDGFRLDGFAHNDQGAAGTGTVLGHIAYKTGAPTSNVYVSSSSIQTYDPIFPASEDRSWTSSVCYQSNNFGLTANWVNPHNAFEVTQDNGQPHPWDNATFDAAWINSYNSMNSDGPGGHNWSKYETEVSGNGEFVIQLLADNCSWVYLADENGDNPRLVGYQGATSSPGEYGVTLDGTHQLSFVIFDGGGLAGGKFRLETTEEFGGTPPPIDTNNAPVADAGADQTLTATGATTSVTLDGSGSSDADGDALSYSWTLDGSVVSTDASFSTNLADGSYTFTLTVSDGEESDSDEVSVTVVNTIPVANAGADQTLEATGATTTVTLNGSATDADGDALTYSWSNGAAGASTSVDLAVGTHTFTMTVTDEQGATDSDQVTVTITDTTAPVISFNQETNSLWPPNHKMVLVATGITASDIVDGTTDVQVEVSSSEAANGKGDGNTDSDYEIRVNFDGSIDVYVRAERSGKGKTGRTYTITMTTGDVAGNSSVNSFEVSVAKSQGRTK
ncbi:MAG TPA: hypothetical protein DCX27_00895 [Balneola sp.]|nr:hypothetical protein [Balneola sp.]